MAIFSKKKKTDEKKEKQLEDKKVVEKKVIEKKVEKKAEEKVEEKTEKSMKDLYAESETKAKKVTGKKAERIITGNAYRVLVKPLVTEKAANLGAQNQYVFVVEKSANKVEIAKAIFQVYGVKPISVNVVNNRGKVVRRGRQTGRRKNWKKAIITLPKDKSINIYEGV